MFEDWITPWKFCEKHRDTLGPQDIFFLAIMEGNLRGKAVPIHCITSLLPQNRKDTNTQEGGTP